MPDLPSCAADRNTLEEVDSGFYWLIAPGVDPSTVLSQEQIDCHMAAAEVINASFEETTALNGKFVHWRSSPTWVDVSSSTVQDWYKAEPLTDPGIACDPDAWNAAFEPTPAWRWRGSYAKALVTYYCIGDAPVDPPVEPPEDGAAVCGDWSVSFVRPIVVEANTPTWIEFEITGTFPPEVLTDPAITLLFDGSSDIVLPDTGSGILSIDLPGRRVQVVLVDNAPHTLSVSVVQEECDNPLRFDSEVLRVLSEVVFECAPSYANLGASVCGAGDYHVVLTICGVDHQSNTVTVNEDGTVLPRLPVIIRHPETQVVAIGSTVILTVVALYATDFQWQIADSVSWLDIPGETSPNLELDPVRLQDSGRYRVVVSNSAGSVTSNVATLTILENTQCQTYIVLRCEDDSPATCHGVHLSRVGDGYDDIDFVLDWVSSTSLCELPVIIDADDGATNWELYMQKVGPGTDPADYVIRWRAATSPFVGQRQLMFEETGECYRVVMSKVGAGTGESDYVLDWRKT